MIAWLLAFLLHSTIWCSLAWLLVRLRADLDPRTRETAWYVAIALSLLTPTIQSLVPAESAFWSIAIAQSAAGEHGGLLWDSGEHSRSAQSIVWPTVGLIAWVLVASALIAVHALRLFSFRRSVRLREDVQDLRALRVLEELSKRADLASLPRLTECHSLNTPVAFGFGLRREICVPIRALHELDDDELSALLGHEVAHHRRGDGRRSLVIALIQAAFFAQPLLHLAKRDICVAAEQQCDDWAALQIDDRVAMASCLTLVAGWIRPRDRTIPVPCIGRRSGHLETRVTRLLQSQASWSPRLRTLLIVAAPLITATSLLTPTVTSVSIDHDIEHPSGFRADHHRGEHGEHRTEGRRHEH